jgi:hypothetical protein
VRDGPWLKTSVVLLYWNEIWRDPDEPLYVHGVRAGNETYPEPVLRPLHNNASISICSNEISTYTIGWEKCRNLSPVSSIPQSRSCKHVPRHAQHAPLQRNAGRRD